MIVLINEIPNKLTDIYGNESMGLLMSPQMWVNMLQTQTATKGSFHISLNYTFTFPQSWTLIWNPLIFFFMFLILILMPLKKSFGNNVNCKALNMLKLLFLFKWNVKRFYSKSTSISFYCLPELIFKETLLLPASDSNFQCLSKPTWNWC